MGTIEARATLLLGTLRAYAVARRTMLRGGPDVRALAKRGLIAQNANGYWLDAEFFPFDGADGLPMSCLASKHPRPPTDTATPTPKGPDDAR